MPAEQALLSSPGQQQAACCRVHTRQQATCFDLEALSNPGAQRQRKSHSDEVRAVEMQAGSKHG